MRIITTLALAITLAAPSMALAKGGKPDKGWGNPSHPGGPPGNPGHRGGPPGHAGKFAVGDHSAIRAYYSQAFARGSCPPGLAKKHNGCLPPGHAKRWVIGAPLAVGIVWYAVPHELVVRLSPPPIGFRYIYLDGAVLLFNPTTRLVGDGVSINVGINIR